MRFCNVVNLLQKKPTHFYSNPAKNTNIFLSLVNPLSSAVTLKKIKTKICHITSGHNPFDDRIFYRECKSVAKAGYDVVLIAQHHSDEIVNGVKIVALPIAKSRFHRMFKLTFKAFWLALKQRSDIYHFHDPDFIIFGVLLKLITRKPVIYDCHEYYAEAILSKDYLSKHYRRILSLLFKLYEKTLYPIFDYIFGVIDGQKIDFPRASFLALHNFPPKSYFINTRKHKKEYELIYAGTLGKERGLFMMLELIKKLKEYEKFENVKLVLLGSILNEKLKQEFNDFIIENSLRKNILYLGTKPFEEVIVFLNKSKIGLRLAMKTRQYDDKPQIATKIFEYMGVGIPLISTDFKYTKKFMNNAEYIFLVPENNIDDCVEKVKYLLENNEIREELGRKAYSDFINNYTWENEAHKLLQTYKKLLFQN